MATARDKVVQYLQDARAAEYALTTMVVANIAVTPEGDYRRRLESQRRRSREREHRLSERLGELGARRNLGNLGLDTARIVAAQTIAWATVPLQLLRGPDNEDRLLRNARDLCAGAAALAADYRALEQIAHASRDEATAKLAVDLRAESDDLLSECFSAIDPLAEAVVVGTFAGERGYRPGATDALRTLRLPQLQEGLLRLREEAADALRSARRGAMRLEARTIIPGYDSLSVEEIRDRLPRLTQAEQATVEAYERTTRNRAAVLEALRDQRGKEPWPGYDEMSVGDIRSRLGEADPDAVRGVLEYEREHRNRSSILNAPEAMAKVNAG